MKNHRGIAMQQPANTYSIGFPALLRLMCFLLTASYVLATSGIALAEESDLWNTLRSGNHIALIRHAIAPGMGDPADFTLGDCSTQRNLSEEGRKQARKIGERFRAHGINKALLFSSQWCRCLETAQLLGLGPVQELPALNSFFKHYERGEPQTEILKEWIAGQDINEPLVLVTHQVNITALTNVFPASGEIVIISQSRAGDFTVAGSVRTD